MINLRPSSRCCCDGNAFIEAVDGTLILSSNSFDELLFDNNNKSSKPVGGAITDPRTCWDDLSFEFCKVLVLLVKEEEL